MTRREGFGDSTGCAAFADLSLAVPVTYNRPMFAGKMNKLHLRIFALPALLLLSAGAGAQNFPPLNVEISAEHPLFIFQNSAPAGGGPEQYAQQLITAYGQLPETLRPYSVLSIAVAGENAAARKKAFQGLLPGLQTANIPVVIRISDTSPKWRYPQEELEEILNAFTIVKGVETAGLSFNEYDPEAGERARLSDQAAWLAGIIDTAARYGRFTYIPMDGIDWCRMLSNPANRPLYNKFTQCQGHVIPACLHRGPHTVTGVSALMGLWLEEAAGQWAIAADSRWYSDAGFVEPGTFGIAGNAVSIPSSLYRAMILNGAMTGAAVYAFAPDSDLWMGAARHHWDQAIYPALTDLLDLGLIARKDFVRKKTPVVFQLEPAATPPAFHKNLRDIDGVLDQGLLLQGAYGMERPGQIPELILNRGDHYWVPIVSAFAPPELMSTFDVVAKPGAMPSAQEWSALLDRYAKPDGQGTAFITHVGRGLFIMNTRENDVEPQTFSVGEVPAPVRGVSAKRENNALTLTWPFREGDVSYKVYKRVLPGTRFAPVASGLDNRRWVDETLGADQSVAYAVTALTNEKETFEGSVNYGEYLTLSMVESRILEEVVISPQVNFAESVPLLNTAKDLTARPWWPAVDGLDETQLAAARPIIAQIEAWDQAFSAEFLNGVMSVYAADYQDPQGWGGQYVQRAYQWFFEHCRGLHMHRQIRQWDFNAGAANGQVNVLLYCRLTGVSISDVSGRTADVPLALPRTGTAEAWVTWAERDGTWKIVQTNPALPNFRDLLSYSASPYEPLPPGPDQVSAP